jgi:hypothetical protein
MLTDRRRVELAIPARLLFTVSMTKAFICYGDTGEVIDATGEAVVQEMRELLKLTCIEPFEDLLEHELTRKRGRKIMERIERLNKLLADDFDGHSALKVALATVYFIQELIDTGYLELIEGSNFAKAADILLPMLEKGAEGKPEVERSARKAGRRVLAKLRAEGLYPTSGGKP